MGIGQDAFDARFATELEALSGMGLAAGLVGRTYVHPALGIAFTCPPDWTLPDLSDVVKGIEGRRINSELEPLNEAIRAASLQQLPLVVVAAPMLDDPIARIGPDEIRPLITVLLEDTVDPAEESTFDLLEYVNTNLFYSHALMEDYRLLERPQRTTLSGCDAVTYRAAYTTLHGDAVDRCPFRDRAYYVRRGPAIYSIRMGDYPDRDPRLAVDFGSVVDSICLS